MTDADDAGALLRQSLLDFHGRMSQSIARLSEAPAAAADELDGLLCDWPRFKGETTELARRSAAREGVSSAWVDAELAQWQASLRLTLAMARYRLGETALCGAHLRAYLELTLGQRDPQRAMALQLLARMALDEGRPDLARAHVAELELEALSWTDAAAWRGVAPAGQEDAAARAAGRQVAAAQAMRADVDLAEGDRQAYLRHSAAALERAGQCGADDDARTLWWARTQYELIWDSTGQRLDHADAEMRAAAPAVVREQPDFKRRLLQLRAHVWAYRGRSDTARRLLQQALDDMQPDDPAAWSLRLDLADALSAAGQHAAALQEARCALALARQADSPTLVRRCADHLRAVQLASADPLAINEALADLDAEPDDGLAPADTASRLQTRVQLLMALKRPRDALETVARMHAMPAAARQQAHIGEAACAAMKAAALRLDGQVAAAAVVLEQAADRIGAPGGEQGRWRDSDRQWQQLALGAALQRADLGQADAALVWSERAREPLWRSAFARHGLADASVDLAALRLRLQARRAAVLVLILGRQRTAALVVPATGGAPWARMLPVGEADWQTRLADMERGEANWNPQFSANLGAFSAWLGPVLADAVQGAELLCVVPEGMLALLPFSGLCLPDGRPLALHCPSALLPALRFAARAAPQPRVGRRLLSAGAGGTRSNDGRVLHDFDAMAQAVAQAFDGAGVGVALIDAPLGRFLSEAPAFDALHLSLHGNVQPGQLDPLAASTLEFRHAERLSARRLAEHWCAGIDVEHVFVNACVSAGYAFGRDAGAGGFWQALVSVGARAVTGTLAYVEPAQAQALALGFYRHWQAGRSIAQALCAAQRELHRSGLPSSAWATHTAVVTYL